MVLHWNVREFCERSAKPILLTLCTDVSSNYVVCLKSEDSWDAGRDKPPRNYQRDRNQIQNDYSRKPFYPRAQQQEKNQCRQKCKRCGCRVNATVRTKKQNQQNPDSNRQARAQ